jgi:hypothetical protein
VFGKQPGPYVARRFRDMGFDRAFAPGPRVPEALGMLAADLATRTPKAGRQ